MVQVHGARAQRLTARTGGVALEQLVAVPVDVGKSVACAMACDFTGQVLLAPVEFSLTRPGVDGFVARVAAVVPPAARLVRVGVEAAGHYHLPVTAAGVWPAAWEVVELNPGHVTAQRRVNGSRGVKTDQVDLVAIADLLLAGRGQPLRHAGDPLVELSAWVAHRRRRVEVRTTKNQLTGQLDRCFPGLGLAISSVLDTKVGRLVAAHFADPERLARLGVARFRAFAAHRDVRVSTPVAERLVTAARDALPTVEAHVARQVLACDLTLLERLDAQVAEADARIAVLLPATAYQVLTTTPPGGGRCAPPPTPPASASSPAGPRRTSSTARRG